MPDQRIDNCAASVAAMRKEFDAAVTACGGAVRESHHRIAGRHMLLRVAGDSLADEIFLPFGHLTASCRDRADLTIEIWDQASTGVGCGGASVTQGDEPYYSINASDDGRFVRDERNHNMAWLDRREGRITAWTEDASLLYLDERARPFRRLLSVWLDDMGIQLSHCGLISKGGSGVLFVGNQGAGKTTSSIACLQGGLGYLGDDFVGIGRAPDASFLGYSLYASCLVNSSHLLRFPELGPHALTANHGHEEKSVVYFATVYPERLTESVRIAAVVLPKVVESKRTSFRRASRAQALLALAPTAVMFLTKANARSMDLLGDLVESVPCYWLELGADVAQIPGAVERLLEDTTP